MSLKPLRAMGNLKRPLRLIVRVTERTTNKRGQYLLLPAIELETWRASLADESITVIEVYKTTGGNRAYLVQPASICQDCRLGG